MYELKCLNPISMQLEAVFTVPGTDEDQASQKAEEFMRACGIKVGELTPQGAERGKPVLAFKDQDSIASDIGGFYFVANQVYFIFRHIKETLGLEINSFIDLGCGPGNILLSAQKIFGSAELTGVEFDPELVGQARENTRPFGGTIIEADLLEWKPEVNSYDMIYIYDPIRNGNIRPKFFAVLAEWLNDGQYVYFQRVSRGVPAWLKKVEIPGYEHPCLYTFDKTKRDVLEFV
jgi:SAM-dependent methyltransferase